MLRWGLRPFFRPLFHTSLLTVFWCFQALRGPPKWRQNHEKSLLEGHLCASFVFSMHFSRFLSILHAFGPWKIGVFLWKVLQIWGFGVFCNFLSSCSLKPHFGPILAPFRGPKSLKTALGRGSEKWWFFGYFFFTIFVIFGSLGGSQGSPRGHHFRVIFVFFGVREANLLLRPPSWPNFANFWWF